MSSPAVLREVLGVLLETADATALHQVLERLLAAARPEQHKTVLRAAIAQLLEDDPAGPVQPSAAAPRKPVSSKRSQASRLPTRMAPSGGARWTDLRPRLRALVKGGVTEQEIADGIGIALSTLRRLLTKVKKAPSPGIIARTAAWLVAHEPSGAGDAAPVVPGADHLPVSERDKLSMWATHDREGLRRDAHISRDELERAIAGEPLDPAIIMRLNEVLAT